MSRKLKVTTIVPDPKGQGHLILGPDDEVPDWAVQHIDKEHFECSGDDADDDSAPAKSASKGDWVEYAVSQGADRDEAEAATKDDLVQQYGN